MGIMGWIKGAAKDTNAQRLSRTAQLGRTLRIAVLDRKSGETVERVRDRHLIAKVERKIRGLGEVFFCQQKFAFAEAGGAEIIQRIADGAFVIESAKQRQRLLEQRTCACEIFFSSREIAEKT